MPQGKELICSMSAYVAKDAGERGMQKVDDEMKYRLDLTCLYSMENFWLSPVCLLER